MKNISYVEIMLEQQIVSDIESVLRENETLSAFLEQTIRRAIEHRIVEREFNERGERAWKEYRRTGVSHSFEEVTDRLGALIEKKRKRIEGLEAPTNPSEDANPQLPAE